MSWILTHTGKRFDLIHPLAELVDLLDIAQGLAFTCRFSGQCATFYSVAQHSVLVSEIVPAHLALEALLHDASEAYIGDVTRPLKHLLPDYRAVERGVERAIRQAFDFPAEQSPEIGAADVILLATERRDLMPLDSAEWPVISGVCPLAKTIEALDPQRAKSLFLERLLTILQQ